MDKRRGARARAIIERLLQGVEGQIGPQRARHAPAHDPTGEDVDHERDVREARHVAYKNGKLLRLPLLDKPKEGRPREGFLERDHFDAVRRRLEVDLQVAVTIAYMYGWRVQSESCAWRTFSSISRPVRCG